MDQPTASAATAPGAAGSTPAAPDVLVGTFNEPGELPPALVSSGGLVQTSGWPRDPRAVAGAGPDAPAWLVRGIEGTPSAGHLYAALHVSGGGLAVLAPSPGGSEQDPGLAAVQQLSGTGEHTSHLALDPSGRWLAAISAPDAVLTLVPIGDDGRLGQPVTVPVPVGAGSIQPRQHAPEPRAVAFLDADHVLIADLGADRLLGYSVSELAEAGAQVTDVAAAEGGPVAPEPSFVHLLPAGTGPRDLLLLPAVEGWAGYRIAVLGELDSRVHLLDLAVDGQGAPESVIEVSVVPSHRPDEDPTAVREAVPAHLVPSADGRLLYVANRGRGSIGVIRLGETPDLVAEVSAGGTWPVHLALGATPVGTRTLYVALGREDAVVGLGLDAEGIPGELSGRVTVRRPAFLLPLSTV